MKTSTIQKEIDRINDLYDRSAVIEKNSEMEYGFVTEKAQKQARKLLDRSEAATEKLISRLHDKGLCSVLGVTGDETNNDCFRDISQLWTIGDGTWC